MVKLRPEIINEHQNIKHVLRVCYYSVAHTDTHTDIYVQIQTSSWSNGYSTH